MADLTSNSPDQSAPSAGLDKTSKLSRLPGIKLLNKLSIGNKLNFGFGLLVLLTLLVVALGFVASSQATTKIDVTEGQHVPATLALTRAEENLLNMIASLQGYLVLSDARYRNDYKTIEQDFRSNLNELNDLSANWSAEDVARLRTLETVFEEWVPLSEQLFDLHDNPRANQPAIDIVRSQIQPLNLTIISQIDNIVAALEQQDLTAEESQLLENLIEFRTTFDGMVTNLVAFAVSGDLGFKFGYDTQFANNTSAWEQILNQQSLLNETLQDDLQTVAERRAEFVELPDQIFEVGVSERAYEDIYLFRTEAAPRAEQMLQVLADLSGEQQTLLQTDLGIARQGLNSAQIQTFLGGLLAVLVGGVLAVVFRDNIVGPIRRLTATAGRIIAGDMSARTTVESTDEVGQLATSFNTMTTRLSSTIENLDKQSQELGILVEISQNLVQILDLNELLRQTVKLTKETLNFYYVHIYLLDEENKTLVMTEGYGQAGAEMKRAGHTIPLNAPTSLVARAARTGQLVNVDNVREAPDWLPNPLLPDTYSEIAVPIVVDNKVAGVLDVQEDKIAGFSQSDANLLRSLANQVAVAVRNARLFDEVETALAEAHAAQERYMTHAWKRAAAAPHRLERVYATPDAPPLDEASAASAQKLALAGEEPLVISLDDHHQTKSIVAPITLGQQKIGALQLHRLASETESGQWDEEDLALLQAVLDQVAQTAESLRLFDETQERASREATIRTVTDKLRAAPNLERLLEIAITEISQLFPVKHAELELGSVDQSVSHEHGNGSNGNYSVDVAQSLPPEGDLQDG